MVQSTTYNFCKRITFLSIKQLLSSIPNLLRLCFFLLRQEGESIKHIFLATSLFPLLDYHSCLLSALLCMLLLTYMSSSSSRLAANSAAAMKPVAGTASEIHTQDNPVPLNHMATMPRSTPGPPTKPLPPLPPKNPPPSSTVPIPLPRYMPPCIVYTVLCPYS